MAPGEKENADARKELDNRIREVKVTKSRCKAVFTRFRNQLMNELIDDDLNKGEIDSLSEKLLSASERAMDIMEQLMQLYVEIDDSNSANSVVSEMATMEEE